MKLLKRIIFYIVLIPLVYWWMQDWTLVWWTIGVIFFFDYFLFLNNFKSEEAESEDI